MFGDKRTATFQFHSWTPYSPALSWHFFELRKTEILPDVPKETSSTRSTVGFRSLSLHHQPRSHHTGCQVVTLQPSGASMRVLAHAKDQYAAQLLSVWRSLARYAYRILPTELHTRHEDSTLLRRKRGKGVRLFSCASLLVKLHKLFDIIKVIRDGLLVMRSHPGALVDRMIYPDWL